MCKFCGIRHEALGPHPPPPLQVPYCRHIDQHYKSNFYRVIKSNCNKSFFSGKRENSKKWPNSIIFGGWFAAVFVFWCLTMVRWKKVVPFRAVPKWCFGSIPQGPRTQIPPKHIHTCPISMITTQIPLDIPQTPSDIPQTYPGNTTCQQSPTDTARHPNTLTGAVWVCLAGSIGVCCCLFACRVSVGCLEVSVGCLGVSEWYS